MQQNYASFRQNTFHHRKKLFLANEYIMFKRNIWSTKLSLNYRKQKKTLLQGYKQYIYKNE